MVSCPIFQSSSHSEFIFVYGVRECSNFVVANRNFSFYFLSVINRSKQLLVVLLGLRKDEKEGGGKRQIDKV